MHARRARPNGWKLFRYILPSNRMGRYRSRASVGPYRGRLIRKVSGKRYKIIRLSIIHARTHRAHEKKLDTSIFIIVVVVVFFFFMLACLRTEKKIKTNYTPKTATSATAKILSVGTRLPCDLGLIWYVSVSRGIRKTLVCCFFSFIFFFFFIMRVREVLRVRSRKCHAT